VVDERSMLVTAEEGFLEQVAPGWCKITAHETRGVLKFWVKDAEETLVRGVFGVR
jgi:hypothetical protein